MITTLDAAAQDAATAALWHHLTEVGTLMEALTPADFLRSDSRGPTHDPDFPPRKGEFRTARVTEILEPTGKAHLALDLGGHACTVDRDGIVRVALAVWRGAQGNRYAKVPTAQVDAFVEAVPVGSVVWASVRDTPEEGPALCDLEVRPELQGAVMVVEDGQIRAMVGGNDNRNFNRATAARQMGSTWKPLVYHAALQLGWEPEELLDNRRNIFPWSTTFYLPRPDHEPVDEVSMSWAGVNSENLASVWLLYHLTDRLDGERVRELAHSLGLARRADESDDDYRLRIQKAGVLPTPNRVAEGLFLQARQEVLDRLDDDPRVLDGRSERLALQSLLYGWGFSRERRRSGKRAHVARALDNSWLHLEPMLDGCAEQHELFARAWDRARVPPSALVPDLTVLLDENRVRVACGHVPQGFVAPDQDFLDAALSLDPVGEVDPSPESMRRARRRSLFDALRPGPRLPQLDSVDDLLIDDRLRLSTLRSVREVLSRRKLALELSEEPVDLYAPEILYNHQDFRVLLGLRYVTSLAEQYGVQTEINQVLSMPLGASEVTLEEITSVYQGISSGQSWAFPGEASGRTVASPAAPALLIAEIRDVDGNVLYKAAPEPAEVVSTEVGQLTHDILRNVVRWGTGRRADTAVWSGGAAVPLAGKTGTTNDFKNAAFLGMAPRWIDGRFRSEGAYAVGVYVGYDDNRPMSRKGIRLAGASGALPAWIATVRGLADSGLLGEPDVEATSERWELAVPGGMRRLQVDPEAGGTPFDPDSVPTEASPEEQASVLVRTRPEPPPHLRFDFFDRPARVAPRTEQLGPDYEPRRTPWGRRGPRPGRLE